MGAHVLRRQLVVQEDRENLGLGRRLGHKRLRNRATHEPRDGVLQLGAAQLVQVVTPQEPRARPARPEEGRAV